MNTDTKTPTTEKQPSNLIARHKRHQTMLEAHRERKQRRKEEHRMRKFSPYRRGIPPILYL